VNWNLQPKCSTKTLNQKYTYNATAAKERGITVLLGYATKVFVKILEPEITLECNINHKRVVSGRLEHGSKLFDEKS
jgi:hypothetical protein